ncbi:MAG: HupE/UreJ family protein [Deltaproteobacteria bacterium]|nr:HupE/UreJ family protein [Deltaproteobacteria bacterium]
MKKTFFYPLTIGILLFVPLTVLAHTGVGSTTGLIAGLCHPFMGLDHMLAMIAVGLWAAQRGGRAVIGLPLTFVSLMIMGGILSFCGISVPFVEEGILVSVLGLGLLIVTAFKVTTVFSVVVVAVCAVFHGHAHGSEIPAAAGAVTYSAGFALATALLHITGIFCGTALDKSTFKMALRLGGGMIALGGLFLALISL